MTIILDKIANNPKSGDQLILLPIKKKKPYFYIVIISAFLGAILLWLYAIGYESSIFDRKITGVPVTITGIDKLREKKQFMVYEDLNIDIAVTISGKRSLLNTIDAEDLIATVDVSNVEQPGENTLPIKITVPNGTGIREQTLTSVSLYLDEFIAKTIPVNVNYIDYVLPEGLKIGETEINPVVVTIDGPKNELDKINSAYVDLSLGEIKGSIAAYGPMVLKYDSGKPVTSKYVKLNKKDAYVSISVHKEKTVPIRVALTGGVFITDSAVITLSQKNITISGSIEIIDSISEVTINVNETAYDLKSTININKYFSTLLPAGVTTVNGEVRITADIKIPDITKKNFTIKADKIIVKQIDNSKIIPKNNITITVIGKRDVLKDLKIDEISASIDAASIYINAEDNEVANVDFIFADGINGVYIYGTYTINTFTQK